MTPARTLSTAAAAVACLIAVLAPLPLALTVLFAVPLVLVLPGVALLGAFDAWTLGGLQRLVLVPAISICTVVALTLLLDLTPVALTDRSWAVTLAALVVAGCGVAYRRGSDTPTPLSRSLRLRRLDVVAIALAVAAFSAAIVLVRTPLAARPAKGYTILSLVRGSGSTVRVQVASGEQRATTYRLVVHIGPRFIYRARVSLEPGEQVFRVLPTHDRFEPVRALLYRGGQTQVYRRANLGSR